MGFRVTAEEKEMIERRMSQSQITSLRTYLLKMAVDGCVINLELSSVSECTRLLRNVSNNINQIAKHANTIGGLYASDIAKIKSQLEDIWQQQDKIINSVSKLMKAV